MAALIVLSSLVCADSIPFNEADWYQYPDDDFFTTLVNYDDETSPGNYSTATLSEDPDPFGGLTSLSNDGGVFDPVIIDYAGGPATLEFDWSFNQTGVDALFVDLTDPSLYDPVFGPWFVGPPFSLAVFDTDSGHESWDLTALGFTGPIGITFDLFNLDGEVGSTAVISNLALVVPDTGPPPGVIPEPGTCVLFGAALIGYAIHRRRRHAS